jgi:hypothetical protein
MNNNIENYIALINDFLNKIVDAQTFCGKIISQWMIDRDFEYENNITYSGHNLELNLKICMLHSSCSSYSPQKNDMWEINEDELFCEVKKIYSEISDLIR